MRSDRNSLFRKLAARNTRNSAKDYFIYFFTLTLSVGLFYSFNSISTQFSSLGLADPLNYLAFSSGVLTAFSVLVCAVMGTLVVHANRFLLRRRKKEMGIYATLGMERRDLNRLLMQETVRIGGFSLAAGLVLGIFAAQILSLLTARLTGISLASYRFMISGKSIVLSIVFFGILFFFVHLFNVRELKKLSLLDMLRADRTNENVSDRLGFFTVPAAVLSVTLMAGGYGLLIRMAEREVFKALAWGGLLLMAGTVLFFLSVLRIMAVVMKKNRRSYYRGLNIFTVGQFSSRLKTEGTSLALTCILLFLSLTLVILGPGLGKYVINGVEYATPYDGSIFYAPGASDMPELSNASEASEMPELSNASEAGPDARASGTSSAAAGDPLRYLEQSGFDLKQISDRYEGMWIYEDSSITVGDEPLSVIGVEDFNRMLALQNLPAIRLEDGEYAVSYAFPSAEDKVKAFAGKFRQLKLGDLELTLAEDGIYRYGWENRNMLAESGTLIVPRQAAEQLTPRRWLLNFNFTEGAKLDGLGLHEMWVESAPDGYVMWSREEALISLTADNLLMTYLGIYLGITFLVTAGAALAQKNLCQAADNGKRYDLLKKLGVSPEDMRRSLRKQLRVYFGFPLVLALLHSGAVIVVIFRAFEGLDFAAAAAVAGFGSLMVLAVYGVYFLTTYVGSRRVLGI